MIEIDENFKNLIVIGISLTALTLSIITFFNHKKRYIKQKAYEWSVDKVMEYLTLTDVCWRQSTIVHPYMGYLATKSNNGISWAIIDEEKESQQQMLNYKSFKEQLLDLFYFFNNESNPLVNQVLKQNEMKECFQILDKYKPFSINTFVELEKEHKFITISNDLLKIKSVLNNSLAKTII